MEGDISWGHRNSNVTPKLSHSAPPRHPVGRGAPLGGWGPRDPLRLLAPALRRALIEMSPHCKFDTRHLWRGEDPPTPPVTSIASGTGDTGLDFIDWAGRAIPVSIGTPAEERPIPYHLRHRPGRYGRLLYFWVIRAISYHLLKRPGSHRFYRTSDATRGSGHIRGRQGRRGSI